MKLPGLAVLVTTASAGLQHCICAAEPSVSSCVAVAADDADSDGAACLLDSEDEMAALQVRRGVQKKSLDPVPAPAPAPCPDSKNRFLLPAFSKFVNGALKLALKHADPANVTFHAGQYDLDLFLCSVGLEMNSTVKVSGFKDAQIEELTCLQQQCLEEGRWVGCKKEEYTFSAAIKFGNIVRIDAKNAADWHLCGLDIDTSNVTMGAESVNPGQKVDFVISREGLTSYKIKKVQNLVTDWGTLQNFTCGFSVLPDFVGSMVESLCADITEFVVEQAETYLGHELDELLLGFINEQFEVAEDDAAEE